MNKGRKIISAVMLLCSFILLLSVIVPHHHHSDGRACYKLLQTEANEGNDHGNENHDSCGSAHSLFVSNGHSAYAADGDADFFLVPLQVLFDYLNPLSAVSHKGLIQKWDAVYIESLHGVWVTDATGLRAPPQA